MRGRRNLRQTMQDERGVTLIEALAGAAILAIIVIAFVQLSGYNMLAGHKSDRTTQAQRAADQVLGAIRKDVNNGTPIATYPWTTGTYACTSAVSPCDAVLPPYSQMAIAYQPFTGTQVTMPTNGLPRQINAHAIVLLNNAPQLVTVTVTWEERQ